MRNKKENIKRRKAKGRKKEKEGETNRDKKSDKRKIIEKSDLL